MIQIYVWKHFESMALWNDVTRISHQKKTEKQQQGNFFLSFFLFSLLNLQHTQPNVGVWTNWFIFSCRTACSLDREEFFFLFQFLHEYSIHNFFKRGILRPFYCKINKIDSNLFFLSVVKETENILCGLVDLFL